jgi:hypothetical protein
MDQKESILNSMRELLAKAERGVNGEPDALNDGWGALEHYGYMRAMLDAINIVETGE